jgi:hypothetical protein
LDEVTKMSKKGKLIIICLAILMLATGIYIFSKTCSHVTPGMKAFKAAPPPDNFEKSADKAARNPVDRFGGAVIRQKDKSEKGEGD